MNLRVQFSEPHALMTRAAHMEREEVLDLIYQLGRDIIDARQQAEGRRIEGHCPMGCGRTLTLGHNGVIECVNPDCPDPVAVTSLLADPETEHVVRKESMPEAGWTWSAKHPLRERIGDELLSCGIDSAVRTRIFAHLDPGTYRIAPSPVGPGGWSYEPYEDQGVKP